MKAIFADTVGLIALWDTSDQWHSHAEQAFDTAAASRSAFVTTSFVLLECANAAARRPYRNEVERLRDQMERSSLLIWPTDMDWRVAWADYARGGAQGASVVDHISFCVMRRLGLSQAFTNDRRFKAAGFETMF